MPNHSPQRVLLFCLSGLGDTVMTSPAIAALAAQPERFRMTLLTMFRSVTDYLLEQCFADDIRFVDFLKGRKSEVFGKLWELRRERFDISVITYPHNRIEYNAVGRVIGARRRIGFRFQRQRHVNLPWLNNIVFDEQPQLHVVQENLRWAAELTGLSVDRLPDDMIFRASEQ